MKFEKEKQLGLDEARLMRGRLLYNLALAASRNVNGARTDVLKHLERAVYTLKQVKFELCIDGSPSKDDTSTRWSDDIISRDSLAARRHQTREGFYRRFV